MITYLLIGELVVAMEPAVVIITKNLEWNIVRILDSIFENVPDIEKVVLVDSASTDNTVELACNYP